MPESLNPEKASAARAYDYLLGGTLNFAADRRLAAEVMAVQPGVKRAAVMNRSFMRRAVLFLVEQGIGQFLDLGSGVPTVGNVHEIAQQARPDAKVVYVDKDPVAVAHSRMLLRDDENTGVVEADITTPDRVFGDPATRRLLDFSKPIGILAITVGHYVPGDPAAMFREYRDAAVAGSHLALTHLTNDLLDYHDVTEAVRRQSASTIFVRDKAEVTELFGDWEILEPGVVMTSRWRPERDEGATEEDAKEDSLYAGVARKD